MGKRQGGGEKKHHTHAVYAYLMSDMHTYTFTNVYTDKILNTTQKNFISHLLFYK